MTRRNVPQAHDAERALLGAVLLRGYEARERCAPMHWRYFFVPQHQTIWAAIDKLVGRCGVLDPVTVAAECGERLTSTGGALTQLSELLDAVFTADNVAHYAQLVREAYMLRRLIVCASELANSAVEDPTEFLMTAKMRFGELDEEWKGMFRPIRFGGVP